MIYYKKFIRRGQDLAMLWCPKGCDAPIDGVGTASWRGSGSLPCGSLDGGGAFDCSVSGKETHERADRSSGEPGRGPD